MEQEENKKEKQSKRRKRSAIFVMVLFLILVHLFLNHDMLTPVLNPGVYKTTNATITGKTTDEFLLLIPKVEMTYIYEGKSYDTEEYFVVQPLFGLSSNPGTQFDIWVNTKSPEFIIIQTDFVKNIYNWIILFFECIGIGYLIKHRKKPNIFVRIKNKGKEWTQNGRKASGKNES